MSRFVVLLSLLLPLCCGADAGPEVPPALLPWVGWALHGAEDQRDCPFAHGDGRQRQCVWIDRLEVDASATGASFSLQARLYSRQRLPLPGDGRHWPVAVRVDDRAQPVLQRGDTPELLLGPGRYRVHGQLEWQNRPDFLAIPRDVALVELRVDQQRISPVQRDAERLWLGRRASPPPAAASNAVRARVFRQLRDELPMRLETRLELEVAGDERELRLGPMLLPGFVPVSLDSPLPARLADDGQLRLQVRPGRWVLSLDARAEGQPASFSLPDRSADWPPQEVWSFAARPALRSVEPLGLPAVDPQQTGLPAEWQTLPAYLMSGSATLELREVQRGDLGPEPDQLELQRQLWLDADGQGLTAQDTITGTVHRPLRLSMQAGYTLGRAELNGRPQIVTRLGVDGAPGLELRPGFIHLHAVSRVDAEALYAGPATGWTADFVQQQAQLHLPPGWRLLAATGVDRAWPSWLARWTLWDVFLVLIIAAAFARLYSLPLGLLALLAMVLSYQEPGAPRFAWLNLAAVIALLRLLPAGRIRRLLQSYRNFSFLGLLLLLLPFATDQLRESIYPQLERPGTIVRFQPPAPAADADADAAISEPVPTALMKRNLREAEVARLPQAYAPLESLSGAEPRRAWRDEDYAADALIQTGPGLPAWRWNEVQLSWSGPVSADESMRLYLLPPSVERALKPVRVLLLVALLLVLLSQNLRVAGRWSLHATPAVLALMLTAVGSSPPAWADIPSRELLRELRERLLEAPDCLPQCATLAEAQLRLDDERLSLDLQLDTAARVSVPLPAHRDHWLPDSVRLRGSEEVPPLALDRGGQLHAVLPPGRHWLEMRGSAAARDLVELRFGLRPHRLRTDAGDWQISGVDQGRLLADSLVLRRPRPQEAQERSTLTPAPAPAFVQVERRLRLGLDWVVETRLVRMAPSHGEIHLQVPLLPGESLTTADIRTRDGLAQITLPAGEGEMNWRGTLARAPSLQLRAPEAVPWVEIWEIEVDTRWHVRFEGLAPVKPAPGQAARQRWQPRPGEELLLRVQTPEAVPGGTLTIDAVRLLQRPGDRVTDVELQLDLRSSRGDTFSFALPEGGILQSLQIDAAPQALPQARDRVRIALHPGAQKVVVHWREQRALKMVTRTSALQLGQAASNVSLDLNMPRDRWILLTAGPAIGPAVLYWGLLLVVLVVALLLGRTGLTPVKGWQWILLGLGLVSTQGSVMGLFVVAWFFALAWRARQKPEHLPYFNLLQSALALLTLLAAAALVASVPAGLLGTPSMHVTGNGSSATLLRWYQDLSGGDLPRGWVLSLPIAWYRVAMLAWSLWLAAALIGWVRWGWQCFSAGGLWHRRPVVATEPSAAHSTAQAVDEAAD